MRCSFPRGRRERNLAFSSQVKATIRAVMSLNVFPSDRFRRRIRKLNSKAREGPEKATRKWFKERPPSEAAFV
jgi:hypothetical protein